MIYIIICEFLLNHVLKYFNPALMKMMLRFRTHDSRTRQWTSDLLREGCLVLLLAFVSWDLSCIPWLSALSQPQSLGWKEII